MGNRKNDQRAIDAAKNARLGLELRKAGATYEVIAERVGYANRASARKAVMRALKNITREPAEEVLDLELARLDQLLLGVWKKASSGDVAAIDRALRIMERRSAYLNLDAPKRTEHTGGGGGPIVTFDLSKLTEDQLDRVEEQLDRLAESPAAEVAGATPVGASTPAPEAGSGGDE